MRYRSAALPTVTMGGLPDSSRVCACRYPVHRVCAHDEQPV